MTDHSAVPSADHLLEAVIETLRDELLPGASGRERYLLRLSVAAIEQVRRELELGVGLEHDHVERLGSLGVADDAALADEIRSGVTTERRAEILAVLRNQVAGRLRVVSPRSSSGSQ